MLDSVVLWGHPESGHACKVALALSLAGLAFQTRWVGIWDAPESRPPEFLALSPLAEVPLLQIGGHAFTQSGAILLEIAARYGVLGGESAAGLQRGRELVVWEANRFGMALPQLIEARRAGAAPVAPEVVAWLRTRHEVDADRFKQLLGDADFFHGQAPGIGDCAIWGYGQWLAKAGVTPSAAMAGWSARMLALPQMRSPQEFFPR